MHSRRFIQLAGLVLAGLWLGGCEPASAPAPDAVALHLPANIQAAPGHDPKGWTLPDPEGDVVYGFSDNQRAFAYRKEARQGEATVYTLHVDFALMGRVPDAVTPALRVSSDQVETPGDQDAGEETRRHFSRQALNVLAAHGFSASTSPGKPLFDRGSFVTRYGREALPDTQKISLTLPDGGPLLLICRTETRPLESDSPQPQRGGALQSSLWIGLDSPPAPGATLSPGEGAALMRETRWQPRIRGYWVRAGYLSPDAEKLVLLVESFHDGSAPQRGRAELFTLGFNLKAHASRFGEGRSLRGFEPPQPVFPLKEAQAPETGGKP